MSPGFLVFTLDCIDLMTNQSDCLDFQPFCQDFPTRRLSFFGACDALRCTDLVECRDDTCIKFRQFVSCSYISSSAIGVWVRRAIYPFLVSSVPISTNAHVERKKSWIQKYGCQSTLAPQNVILAASLLFAIWLLQSLCIFCTSKLFLQPFLPLLVFTFCRLSPSLINILSFATPQLPELRYWAALQGY